MYACNSNCDFSDLIILGISKRMYRENKYATSEVQMTSLKIKTT